MVTIVKKLLKRPRMLNSRQSLVKLVRISPTSFSKLVGEILFLTGNQPNYQGE